MAYLKNWASRSFNEVELRMPDLMSRSPFGKGKALAEDVFEALDQMEGDVAYIDPPYNQHSYLGNYHIWETLARWDKPEFYGIACKRVDCRDRTSVFNSKSKFKDAMTRVILGVKAPMLIVSFNNEGYLTRPEMEEILSSRGEVSVIECSYRRYVGAQIGIYNPQGEKVGKVSHLRNKEFLYVVSESKFLMPESLNALAKSVKEEDRALVVT
jgi:adenine-specific DNA-methyltransferase